MHSFSMDTSRILGLGGGIHVGKNVLDWKTEWEHWKLFGKLLNNLDCGNGCNIFWVMDVMFEVCLSDSVLMYSHKY